MKLLQKIKDWLYVEESGVVFLERGDGSDTTSIVFDRNGNTTPVTLRRNRITRSVAADPHVVNRLVAVNTYTLRKGEYLLVNIGLASTPVSDWGIPRKGWIGPPNGTMVEWRGV